MTTTEHASTKMDRAQWLEWRRSGIGASDVAAILGISPWASPWSIWADKVGLLPHDDDHDDDDPREFGKRAEAMLAPWFEDRTGYHLAAQQAALTHAEIDHHLATLDGLVCDTEPAVNHLELWRLGFAQALGTGEIKTDFGSPWSEIPPHYQGQGQWQLHVTGLDRVWFAVLHGRRFRVYEMERDQADIDLIVARVDEFWHDHVLAGIPPAVDSSEATAKALAVIYPEDNESTVEVDQVVVDQLAELAQAKADEKAAKARARGLTSQLKAAAGEAYELTHAGRKVATVSTQYRSETCAHCGHTERTGPFRVLRPSTAMKQAAQIHNKRQEASES